MTRYNGCFGDDLIHLELTNDFVVAGADDEGRVDLRIRVLEEDGLCEMSVVEHLVINNVAVIVEFFLEPPPFALVVRGLPKRNNTAVRATAITFTAWFFVFIKFLFKNLK